MNSAKVLNVMGLKAKEQPSFTITAGQWRGRKLPLTVQQDLRPSKEMVRQAGLDMLASRVDLTTLNAADICCGSGAWGLELLSRGVNHVIFVDTNTSYVRQHCASLCVSTLNCGLHTGPAEHWLPEQTLDLIIMDPPYDTPLAQQLLHRHQLWGKNGTWWLVETAAHAQLDIPDQLDVVKQQRYGNSQLILLNQRWAAGL